MIHATTFALGVAGVCLLPFVAKSARTRNARSRITSRLVAAGLVSEGKEDGLLLDVVSDDEFKATFNGRGHTPDNVEDLLLKASPMFNARTCEAERLSPTRWHVRFIADEPCYPDIALYADFPTACPPDIRKIPVAYDMKGEAIFADTTVHALTSAVSGAGKSGLLNIMLARLAYSDEVALLGIDLKRGLELSPWKERLTLLAKDAGEALSLLAEVERIMLARFCAMERAGVRKTEPSTQTPWVFLAIDEIAQLRSDDKKEQKEIERLLISLASLGRAAGITLWVSTQRPGVDAIPGGDNVRSNLVARNVLRLANRDQLRLSLGYAEGLEDEENPVKFPIDVKGLCLFTFPEQRTGRIVFVKDEDVERIVADTKQLAIPVEQLRTDGACRLNGALAPRPGDMLRR